MPTQYQDSRELAVSHAFGEKEFENNTVWRPESWSKTFGREVASMARTPAINYRRQTMDVGMFRTDGCWILLNQSLLTMYNDYYQPMYYHQKGAASARLGTLLCFSRLTAVI